MARIGSHLLCVAALALAAASSTAQAATVKEVFEQHNLLGTFALDCSKPVSKANYYDVHRVIDPNHVQRDQMSGPTSRDFVVIWDKATAIGNNEIALSGTHDGKSADAVYRVEGGHMRVMEGTVAGRKVVAGGRAVNGGAMPWVHRCDTPDRQAQASPSAAGVKLVFEKYGLLGTFAWDCSKPVSPGNIYFVNRLIDADHVQHDQMSGPTKRDAVTIFDRAVERTAGEIFLSGTRNDQPTDGVWRVEQNRHRGIEVTIGGKKLVTGERYVNNGRETQWLNKCAQSGTQSEEPQRGFVMNRAAATPVGKWTFEIWHDGRKLAAKTFDVRRP